MRYQIPLSTELYCLHEIRRTEYIYGYILHLSDKHGLSNFGLKYNHFHSHFEIHKGIFYKIK